MCALCTNQSKMGFLGNLFNRAKKVVGKGLQFGGAVLRKAGDIGGSAIKTIGDNAGLLGGIAGTGLSLIGLPEIGIPLAAGAATLGNFAKSKPVQNTVRGVTDVGNALQQGGDILRR